MIWITIWKENDLFFSNQKGYEIKKGDIIKFGRVRFIVTWLSVSKEEEGCLDEDIMNYVEQNVCEANLNWDTIHSFASKDENQNKDPCWICLNEDQSFENPLLEVCKCTGTMRFIHYTCLKEWIASKIHYKLQAHIWSYNWKNLICELCKTKYKVKYTHKGQTYQMLDF